MVRIEIPWSWIEARQPGRSHWEPTLTSELDSFLDEAKAYGIEVLAVVTQDPCWASSDPAKNCGTSLVWDYRFPPANVGDYTRFLVDLHEFAAGRIQYWEIWNEPNLDGLLEKPRPGRLHVPAHGFLLGLEGRRPFGRGGRRSAHRRGGNP